MVYQVFIPKSTNSSWQDYWQKSNFKRELLLCQTDGLLPILKKYFRQGQKIIEAGCGLGKWVIYFDKKGFDIIGVDNNKYVLKKLKSLYPRLKIKFASVEKLPFKENTFDFYLSLGVIEHFRDGPYKALKEAYRVLKPEGIAIIEVPFDNLQRIILRRWRNLSTILKFPAKIALEHLGLRKKRPKIKMDFYEYHYSEKELENFLVKTGFKILERFYKDDLDPKKSIGLWLDFPQLRRKITEADFDLNSFGQKLKQWYDLLNLKWFYSACVVGVVKKPK